MREEKRKQKLIIEDAIVANTNRMATLQYITSPLSENQWTMKEQNSLVQKHSTYFYTFSLIYTYISVHFQ